MGACIQSKKERKNEHTETRIQRRKKGITFKNDVFAYEKTCDNRRQRFPF